MEINISGIGKSIFTDIPPSTRFCEKAETNTRNATENKIDFFIIDKLSVYYYNLSNSTPKSK